MASQATNTTWTIYCGAVVALLSLAAYRTWKSRAVQKEDDRFAADRGCAPPQLWVARWPWGLDLLVKAFRHGVDQTVMEWFTDISERSGTTHEQRLLGARNIGTTDPSNLEAVLTKQFQVAQDFNLGFRIPQFRDLLGSGVLTQEGQAWKHSRDLLRPQFSANRNHSFEDIRASVEALLARIVPRTTVDLQPLFFELTIETTLFMLFGERALKIKSGNDARRREEFSRAMSTAGEYLAYRTRVGDLHWMINGPAMWRACRTVHAFVDAAVSEALEVADEKSGPGEGKKRYVFVDALMEHTRDPKVLRDQCLTLLIAGRDSAACCLTWTMRLLARHPSAMEKVREEVSSSIGLGSDARQPTRDDLKQMTFLQSVIKESLRLYPPIPVNQRAATRTTTLPSGGGSDGQSRVMVRKGESVGYLVYAMHRRKDIYGPDAREFRPERWANDALKDIGYAYLPFGAGPRACLGQEFAVLETAYTVARLTQWYPFVTLPAGETLEIGKEKQALTLVLSCAEGCRVRLSDTDIVPPAFGSPMEPTVNPRFTQPDIVVLGNLIQDAKSDIRGDRAAQVDKAAPEVMEMNATQEAGQADHDKQAIALLKAYNDPGCADFTPTILTTWDKKDLPDFLNRYVFEPYARLATQVVRHPTDVVFLTHIIQYMTVNLGSALWLYTHFSYVHGILHTAYTGWCIASFTLLMHNHIHNNGVLRKSWAWLDSTFPYILEPLMGHTWDSYYYHHVKHHHVESNGPEDLSSTIRYQRDSPVDFLLYYGRFLFLIWAELPLYFIRKGKSNLAVRAFCSEVASYAFLVYMTKLNPRAATFVFLLPFAVLRLALMVGNWGQHALVDEIDPNSDFRTSITMIDVMSNRDCFNDGYHTAHHLNPRRHWREQPVHFLQSKEAYRTGRALVFYDIDWFMMTMKLLQKDYAYLADHLVPMGDQIGMSQTELANMLRTKTKRFTEDDIRKKFK